jgi:hypothetical protein
MAKCKICPNCGASLDFGERCDCTVPIEEYKGHIHRLVDESADKRFMKQIYTMLRLDSLKAGV